MSIVKMKRLRLVGMQSEREELLQRLQCLGTVEIQVPEDHREDPEWSVLTRADDTALAEKKARTAALSAALATLNKYAKADGGLLKPLPLIREGELLDERTAKAAQAAAEEISANEKRIASIYNEQTKLNSQKAALTPWSTLDVPLDVADTRDVTFTFGGVPSRTDLTALEAGLAERTDLCALEWAGRDSELQYVLVICHRSVAEEAEQFLKEYNFSRSTLRGWTGTAQSNIASIEQRLAELETQLGQARAGIAAQAPHRQDLQLALDRLGQEAAREEAKGRLMESQATFFLEGWVPATDVAELEQTLGQFTCAWETADPVEEEIPQVPVKLKNNKLTAPLNVVTNMYSLPAYDGLDPNPLMAPFFIAFFGMMMADMAYGILMIAASLVVLLKTRPREDTRNFMSLVLLCGISTFIVGAMTGGFFGDFIPQILKIINPESTFQMPALFTPLDDTVSILLGSLVLGAIQVFTGMLISVIKKIKDGEFIDALFDEITWWIILGGGAMAFFGIGTVKGVPLVLVAGVLMLVLGGTRKAKGFGKLTSLVGLVYNGVTGFFSDILSYMRLMALMLAGSVIAQVFNTLGSVFGNVVVFIIISMIGNMLNLALNLLGCYVHDLRLQCLEFFGRFYKEGGKPFRPLNMETKYVDIIKEEQ